MFSAPALNDEFNGHEVDEAAAEVVGQILVLHFGIEANHIHAGLPQIAEDEIEQTALALTDVAEDQNVGLVVSSLIEIHQRIVAEPPCIKAVSIRLSGIVEGIEVRHTGDRENTLELVTKHIEGAGHGAREACCWGSISPR